VKSLTRIAGGAAIGVAMLMAPLMATAAVELAQKNAPTPLAPETTAGAPACDDVTAVTAAVTAAIAANPFSAPTVAGETTARCPADAAAIATAAVAANPNRAEDIVVAVLGSLPEEDQKNDVLTAAITSLAGQQSEIPPTLATTIGGSQHAPWTDTLQFAIPVPTSISR
jgi:hypothetical protein